MRTPADTDLLALRREESLPPSLQAPAVLALLSDGDVASMPLGEQHATLLRWYARSAGSRLEATASCPSCGQEVDVTVPVDDVLLGPGPGAGVLEAGGFTVAFHPPTVGEVAEVTAAWPADADRATEALLRACVDGCAGPAGDVDPRDLPPAIRDALEAAMAAADPGAELALVLDCPACAARWTDALEPLDFVRQVLDQRVTALVEQVHVIASAYGWSESEILALPPARRRLYLDVIRS